MRDTAQNMLTKVDLSPSDIPTALSLLTRLPIPVDHAKAAERAANAAWAYPLAGALVGVIAGLVAWILSTVGIPGGMVAGAGLAVLVFLTGGLHEDGLADCADGFGCGTTKDRRLEIMKDSRVGAFGVIALGIALIMRWSGIEGALAGREVLILTAVGAVSRMPMALTMWAMPLARKDGLAAAVGFVSAPAMAVAAILALIIAVVCVGWAGFAIWIVAALAALPVCWLAWRKIEGYTGDVLGCVQQTAEIGALAIAVALLT
ncbi:MAG: adenosylcobinamide-GDP ribazoletransferase [Pseudomonadota bacterium]